MKKVLIAMLILFVAAPCAFAENYGGAEIPDTVVIEGNKLVLNGAGVRRKWGLIKVYTGALFLTSKNSDARRIIKADEPMMIRMHSIRSGVPASKVVASWNKSFAVITGDNTAPYQTQINKFNSAFNTDSVKDDKYDITYLPGKGVIVYANGKQKVVIPGMDFKRIVFSIWLGDDPVDGNLKKLKKAMLGK